MLGRKKKPVPIPEPEVAIDPGKLRDILRNFAMNRISAHTAMKMAGLRTEKALREAMLEHALPFPAKKDVDITPMTDLVLRMMHDQKRKEQNSENS